MSKQAPVFWGCTINQRLPFMESTIRKTLGLMGVTPVDIEGVSCCPDPLYAKTLPHMTWLGIAARNLALAGKHGNTVVSMCNGCYKVLKTAQIELKDAKVRREVNERLEGMGLKYEPTITPVHLLEYLKKLDWPQLKKGFKRKLTGIKVGTHYGCHILRPRDIAVDSVANPVTMEDILKACGAEIVPYAENMLCCGGTLTPFDAVSSEELIRQKMRSLKNAGADALVVVCPSCYVQYDIQSRTLKDKERLPVLHLMELLALALGIAPEELNFSRHSTDVTPVLKKLGLVPGSADLQKRLDMKQLSACCGACTFECSVAKSQPDSNPLRFDPMTVVKKVVAGDIEGAIASPDIWRCLGCYDCAIFCPNNTGLGHTFEILRQMARERGYTPEISQSRLDTLAKTGAEAKGSEMARKKLGLPPAPKAAVEEIKVLFDSEATKGKK